MDHEAPEQPDSFPKEFGRADGTAAEQGAGAEPDGTASGGPKRTARRAPRTRRGKSIGAKTEVKGTAQTDRLKDKPLEGRPTLSDLDLNKLDRELTDREREEWNEIYASLRSRTVLTGTVVGIDTHSFKVRDRDTKRIEYREILCAVVITYRGQGPDPGDGDLAARLGAALPCPARHGWRGNRLCDPGCGPRGRRGHRLPEAGPGRQTSTISTPKRTATKSVSI